MPIFVEVSELRENLYFFGEKVDRSIESKDIMHTLNRRGKTIYSSQIDGDGCAYGTIQ